MFEFLSDPQIWIALLTLTALEIVLGIDNIIFISILAGKLPADQQNRARVVGLGAAMVMRILLLFTISWVIGLTAPFFEVLGMEISGRDLILIGGGLFLLGKSTLEIHGKLEGEEHATGAGAKAASFAGVIAQIMLLDIVFSLDSVITAVGMADDLWVMITAVVIAVGVMMLSAGAISNFVNKHPTVKILALSFLLLIGTSLIAEGLEFHIPKGYIYFAMAFSVFVEVINLRVRGGGGDDGPVQLRDPYHVTDAAEAGPTPPLGAPTPATAEDR
ncbi:MAG: TerC family protein [Chloroflexota bacterium]|nr:TerC family protein [Chloroflexota bacterium]